MRISGHNATVDEDVRPSDLSQAIFRVVLVSAVILWTALSAQTWSIRQLCATSPFQFAAIYWLISLTVLAWTSLVLGKSPRDSVLFPLTRITGIFTDVGAASVYTAISGEAGIILYPVYLTISIGYGYRFGVRYLYLALLISALFFGVASQLNEYIVGNTNLIWAYYIGIALVPLYSASLLNRHREILERLREVNLARSRFIANMSHELRTPLHTIISVSDLLDEEYKYKRDETDGTYQKLRMVGDSAHHLLELVNRVLDIASSEASGPDGRPPTNVDLATAISASLRICQPNAETKNIGFYWHYDLELPKIILGSPDYLQEILINTIGNAIKYTSTGYVHTDFRLTTRSRQSVVVIEIVDTGIGISSKLLPNIFEPFTLGDDSAARNYAGTGLGLTITKQLVLKLAGDITFDTTEGVGTRCVVTLPCNQSIESVGDRIQNDPRATCILLTPRKIPKEEMTAIERAGWICRVYGRSDSFDMVVEGGSAILIDSAYGQTFDQIVDSALPYKASCLIALYESTDDARRGDRMEINAVIRNSNIDDLAAAKSLAIAMFGAVEDDSETVLDFEALGISRVLVADDNATNLKTARLALESCGLQVTTVQSGEHALSQLEIHDFHIAFIDLHMPNMSGVEVTQLYQYLLGEPRTPIVILTADGTTMARENAQDAGAIGVLTKPLRVQELRNAVTNYARKDRLPTNCVVVPRLVGDIGHSVELIDGKTLQEFIDIGVPQTDLQEMLSNFAEDGFELLSCYRNAVLAQDWKSVEEIIHSLKGACAAVGAAEMYERIKKLDFDSSELHALNAGFSYEELCELLKATSEALKRRIDLR